MQHQQYSFGWYLQCEEEREVDTSEFEMAEYVESDNNDNNDIEDLTFSNDSNNNEQNLTYCICSRPYAGEFMVQCDICDEWYHGNCVGIHGDELMPSSYFVCCCCSETKQSKIFNSYQEYLEEAQYIAYVQEYKRQFLEPLYCSCFGIDDGQPMIRCDCCGEWFHQRCCMNESLTEKEINCRDLSLICRECNDDGVHSFVSEKVAADIKNKKKRQSRLQNSISPTTNHTRNYVLQHSSTTPRRIIYGYQNCNIDRNQLVPVENHFFNSFQKLDKHYQNRHKKQVSSFLRSHPRCRKLMFTEEQELLTAWSVCCFEDYQRFFLGTNIGHGIVLKLPDENQLASSASLYSNLMETEILQFDGIKTKLGESKTKQLSFPELYCYQWNTLQNVNGLEENYMENGAWRAVKIPYSSKHVACAYLLHGTISVQDIQRGERIYTIKKAHKAGITDISFPSNDENLMITSSFDKRITTWDCRTNLNNQKIAQSGGSNRHLAAVNGILMLDNNHLVSVSADETVKIWDLRTISNGKMRCISTVNVGDKISSISCSPIGSHLALNTARSEILVVDGNALLYSQDNSTIDTSARFTGHKNGLWELGRATFSPDGQLICTGSEDGSVCVWHITSGIHYRYYQHPTAVWDMCFTSNFDILTVADGGSCSFVSPYVE